MCHSRGMIVREKEKIKGRLSTLSVDNLVSEQLNKLCIQRLRDLAKNYAGFRGLLPTSGFQ